MSSGLLDTQIAAAGQGWQNEHIYFLFILYSATKKK